MEHCEHDTNNSSLDADVTRLKRTPMGRRRFLQMGAASAGLLLTGYGIVSAQNAAQNSLYLPVVVKPADSTATATSTTGATATPTTGATVTPTAGTGQDATPAIVAATNAFLATLSDTQKTSVT